MSEWRRANNDRYTAEEDTVIITFYSQEPLIAIASRLNRSVASVVCRSHTLVRNGVLDPRQRFYNPAWTAAERDMLIDRRGELTDEELGRKIGRSRDAVRCRAEIEGIGYRDNFFTPNQLAPILGVDQKKIVRLGNLGVLRLRRTSIHMGRNAIWRCEIADLERFLVTQSAWYDWRRIEDEPWRGMARKAFERDPWMTTRQVATLAGTSKDWIQRQIRSERMAATQVLGAGGHWVYRIARSEAMRWVASRKQGPLRKSLTA